MSSEFLFNWLVDCGETWVYHYESKRKGIIGSKVVYEKREKGKLFCLWSVDGGVQTYEGEVIVRERNLFVHSEQVPDNIESVLSIFPLPSNYRPVYMWGVATGTADGYPTAFRVLWTKEYLTIPQVEMEFELEEANRENSLIVMDYKPDELNETKAKEAADRERLRANEIIQLNDFFDKDQDDD